MKESKVFREEIFNKAKKIIRKMQDATGSRIDYLADELDFLISQNPWLEERGASTSGKRTTPLGEFVAEELLEQE